MNYLVRITDGSETGGQIASGSYLTEEEYMSHLKGVWEHVNDMNYHSWLKITSNGNVIYNDFLRNLIPWPTKLEWKEINEKSYSGRIFSRYLAEGGA